MFDHDLRAAVQWLAAVFAVIFALGCADPAEEKDIHEQFREYVATANQCQAASECVLVVPGCPLGCFVAVRSERKADVEAKARELIAHYMKDGASCIYECLAPGPVECVQSRCKVSPAVPGNARVGR